LNNVFLAVGPGQYALYQAGAGPSCFTRQGGDGVAGRFSEQFVVLAQEYYKKAREER
jgi:hypothetical protein